MCHQEVSFESLDRAGSEVAVDFSCCTAILVFCLRCANFASVSESNCGFRSLVCVGRSVLVLLPIRRWTGEVPRPSVGVFLQSKKASSGSLLSARAFFNRFLQILTAFSAFPFDWGWCGLEVLCSNFHASANFANSDELNCVPLSVFRTSGMPCLANCTLQAVMTVVEVIRLSSCTSKYLDQ